MSKTFNTHFECKYTNKSVLKSYSLEAPTGSNEFRLQDISCTNSECNNFRNCPYDNEIIAKLKRLG